MKKNYLLLVVCLLLLSFTTAFADDAIVMRVEPCSYWYSGDHKWHTGNITYEDVLVDAWHEHVVLDETGQIIIRSYEDELYKVYRITEEYCACGFIKTRRVFVRSECR